MEKFTYAGYHDTTFTIELGGRKLYVEQVGGKYELSSEGGPIGSFSTFGKAVTAAEKHLVSLNKNNPL